jgi:hypothetical protein
MIAKTQWIYAREALLFVLQYAEDVSTVRTVLKQKVVLDNFNTLYHTLLPLRLFSGSMEAKGGKLSEVMPIMHESLYGLREVRNMLFHGEDLEIFDAFTTQFVARLKANSFATIVTAWVLSDHGLQSLWASQSHTAGLNGLGYCPEYGANLHQAANCPISHGLAQILTPINYPRPSKVDPYNMYRGIIADPSDAALATSASDSHS